MKLSISAKCSDLFSATLSGIPNHDNIEYYGYVPPCVPNDYGDYVTLDIDPETGMILNWKKQTLAQLKKSLRVE